MENLRISAYESSLREIQPSLPLGEEVNWIFRLAVII